MVWGNESIVQVSASSAENQRKTPTLSGGMAHLGGDQLSITETLLPSHGALDKPINFIA